MPPDTYAHEETHTLFTHFHAQPCILSEHIAVEVEAVHSATAGHFSGLLSCHCAARTHTRAHTHTNSNLPPPDLFQPAGGASHDPPPVSRFTQFSLSKTTWSEFDINYDWSSFRSSIYLHEYDDQWKIMRMNNGVKLSERKRIFSSLVISLLGFIFHVGTSTQKAKKICADLTMRK